jgi:predicted metal-dependent hydrolase
MSAGPALALPLPDPAPGNGFIAVRESARARRLALRVFPGGRVEVRVPRGTRADAVRHFIERHRDWIADNVRRYAACVPSSAVALPARIELEALGRAWDVRYEARPRAGWRAGAEGLAVFGDLAARATLRERLLAWLAAVAREELEPWLRSVAVETGLSVRQVQFRRQQTRWGSCSRSGTISLNVCLLFQRPAVVRYLLVHELSHTVHMNHSRRFWGLVERHEPDYRALDRELGRGWQRVPGWVYG